MPVLQCPTPSCNQFLDKHGNCRNCRTSASPRRTTPPSTPTHPVVNVSERVHRALTTATDPTMPLPDGYDPTTRHITVPTGQRLTHPTSSAHEELTGVVSALQLRQGGSSAPLPDRLAAATALTAACNNLSQHLTELEHDLARRMQSTGNTRLIDWQSGRVAIDWGLRRRAWDHDGLTTALTAAFADQTGYSRDTITTVLTDIRGYGTPTRYRTSELAALGISADAYSEKVFRDEPQLRVDSARRPAPLDPPTADAATTAASWLTTITDDIPQLNYHLTNTSLANAVQEYAAIEQRVQQIRVAATHLNSDLAQELTVAGIDHTTDRHGHRVTVSQGRDTTKWDHDSTRQVIVDRIVADRNLPPRQVRWIADCYWQVAAMDTYKKRAITAAGGDLRELTHTHTPAPRLVPADDSQPVPA